MFEIKGKDLAARLGVLSTLHGKVQTPTLMPVINPNRLTLPIDILERCGAEMIITNAYILYRTLKEEVLTKGVHDLLGFKGPIMTDSGAFQLMTYGSIDITNRDISHFQEEIKVDFGVPLDLPQAKGSVESVERALNETIERIKENVRIRQSETVKWVGPVQGGPYPALVEKAAKILGSLPFEIHALGSVVPLMEAYEFTTVVKMLLAAKKNLPLSRPLHLFGAGHPMFFSLAVLCGADIFDSAAYALYAKARRYITPFGTLHLDSMKYFPCRCESCLGTSPKEILTVEMEEQIEFLAFHNILISFQEIMIIRQAIADGRLLDLAQSRAVAHPQLLKALNWVLNDQNYAFFEEHEPATKKKAIFITNNLLLNQPFVNRIKNRLFTRFYPWGRILRVIKANEVIPDAAEEQVVFFSPVFGLVPSELSKTYPFYQSIAGIIEVSTAQRFANDFIHEYSAFFDEIIIEPEIDLNEPILGGKEKSKADLSAQPSGDYFAFRSMVDFQFGRKAGASVQKVFREYSPKTKVLRRFVDENRNLLATVRAKDFFLIPSILLAQQLHSSIEYPRMRVAVTDEAESFLRKGRDAFSKFVKDADPAVRAGDEILVVNKSDELLAAGKAMLSAKEMESFNAGIAVKTRRGLPD
ncbi:MAG: tRNA guanosine(15) transglycosylase TgtA [Candidatus Heimdallarchaeota archaeon]